MESSVEELISDHLLAAFKAESKCYDVHALHPLLFMSRFFQSVTPQLGLPGSRLPQNRQH